MILFLVPPISSGRLEFGSELEWSEGHAPTSAEGDYGGAGTNNKPQILLSGNAPACPGEGRGRFLVPPFVHTKGGKITGR
jgi:hypothetical protein